MLTCADEWVRECGKVRPGSRAEKEIARALSVSVCVSLHTYAGEAVVRKRRSRLVFLRTLAPKNAMMLTSTKILAKKCHYAPMTQSC
jgi:hypothetical protein